MKDWFYDAFFKQVNLQENIKCTICDELVNVVDMYNSATAMMVEIGEMLQTDTRWKKHVTGSKKEPVFNFDEFITELADVFIYMLNVAIYGGVTIETFKKEVTNKLIENRKRFNYD